VERQWRLVVEVALVALHAREKDEEGEREDEDGENVGPS